jgi:hypothetical protein
MQSNPQDAIYTLIPISCRWPTGSAIRWRRQTSRTTLRFRNDRAAREVGLADLDDAAWIAHFGRFAPLPGNLSQPLALRYHGHQFRVYNPELGDGRGFLFAQMRDGRPADGPWHQGFGADAVEPARRWPPHAERRDARGAGDRNARSAGRQYQPDLLRDRNRRIAVARRRAFPTRAAVLVRLSHSHIRIGTFQRLGMLDAPAEMEQLVDYCLASFPGPALPPMRPSRTTRRPGCCTRWSNAWPTWPRATWSPASSMAC